ncbi:MAG: hypothetical protein RMJ05_07985 [Thermomicrobium sp.]|nr:hypothetical protein [Thermomicrobium sp.]MDW8006647.1 hypothetical protein [Thermomicrobium sp.]
MLAGYAHLTTSAHVTANPTRLVALVATAGTTEPLVVTVRDGAATGPVVLVVRVPLSETRAVHPALPVSLTRGLYVELSAAGDVTVFYG